HERFTRVGAEIVHLEGRLRLGKTMRKKYYYGKGLRQYARRHPELFRRQVARPAFTRHWRELASTPGLALGMAALKAAEMAAAGLGFVASALAERRRPT